MVTLLLSLVGWRLHPMHLSMTEVAVDARSTRVTMTVRLFGDDLAAAVSKLSSVAHDSVSVRYVMDRLSIRDERARPMPLSPCGLTRRGDLVWVCVSAALGTGMTMTMTNRVLLELYDDQINIVQVKTGARRQSALYRRGSESQVLRIR